MQPAADWNDLRYLLALRRGGTFAAAARAMKVDDTTVSRRLTALQLAVGQTLIERLGDGRYALTDAGERVAREVEGMEQHARAIGARLNGMTDPCAGIVRVTSTPIIVNRLLAPAAGALIAAHPALTLELAPESRDLNLTRREADIALRLARPVAGGLSLKARRLCELEYAAYTASHLSGDGSQSIPWITYDDAMGYLPQARWITALAMDRATVLSGLRVHDAETAIEAAAAGVGKTLLPTIVAARDARLRVVEVEGAPPTREVWLLVHTDMVKLDRVSATIAWIEAAFQSNRLERDR
jgi:DNA-binding transcriptional LysR family regulator